jgi:hypothetical protein
LYQQDGPRWFVPHPYIGHLHIPDADVLASSPRPDFGSALMDVWGFRNPWPWPERPGIVAVGDSLTYSQTVTDEQAWTTLVARAMPATPIINLGLIGGAPQQYLRIYERFAIDCNPRVLLVGLFLGNDLFGADEFDQWWREGGHGGFPEFREPDAHAGIRGWMARRWRSSSLGALAREVRSSYQSGRLLAGHTLTLQDGGRVQLVPRFLTHMARPRGFTLTLQTIEGIHDLATEHGTRAVILFFPSKEEVYLPLVEGQARDLAAPFLPELEARGIAYLDLGPLFRQRAAAGQTLFWEVDGHPNPRGYALIAEAVIGFLKSHETRLGLASETASPPS